MIRTQPEKSTWVNIWEERVRAKTFEKKWEYVIWSNYLLL